MYVSDRRFMKAINLLQVAAHSDGRTQARSLACLLALSALGISTPVQRSDARLSCV